uniref:ATP synthase F0 subunit 8 n=1 Tax=Protobothrops maolanensis TaxID=1147742 RepID=A0A0A6ZH08_9SAUR|nr:ATP synthase F0 subunit 8 [Protobothrops maolanensis]AGS43677.1 ATP synthase F0 subunit 8 [Protobothrops maolanensis]
MPQLDIVHILMVYLWTWLTLTLITLKIKTFMLIMEPKKQAAFNPKPTTPPAPWT